MIERKQLFRHKPEEGVYGDCHRTAIACLLDLEPEQVPHFLHDNPEPIEFNRRAAEFLADRGLTEVNIAYKGTLQEVLSCMEHSAKGVYYLFGGTSRTGCGHTVIGCGGELVWDPSLDDSGIVGPLSDELYWVTFLVPAFLRKAA